MPIRKKGDVEIQASANGTKVKQTGYTFYSYDKNAAALYFQFRGQDGQPTDLSKATVHLVMILNDDNGKKFIPGDDEIEVVSAIRGTAKYVLPDNLLGYEGKVTSYVYLDFSDGSHTDEGHFAFEIKRSLITDVIPEAGDKYVKDFEDIKAEVQEAADGAKETISQKVTEVSDTSDSAISKVNQAADGTIKTANQAKSDVQSKADEASEDISGIVKTTEDARDNAESQIGDYVDEVESAKGSAIEDIDQALPEVEDKLQDLQKEMIVGGRNYIRNSNLWASKEKKEIKFLSYATLVPGTYVLSADIEIVNAHPKPGLENKRLGVEFKVNYESEKAEWLNCFYYPKEGENYKGRIHDVIEIKDTISFTGQRGLFANQIEGDIVRVGLPKLERGNVPTDWSPAIEDYDAKIKRLEKAITNLGGSV